jgi:hypothetical protein
MAASSTLTSARYPKIRRLHNYASQLRTRRQQLVRLPLSSRLRERFPNVPVQIRLTHQSLQIVLRQLDVLDVRTIVWIFLTSTPLGCLHSQDDGSEAPELLASRSESLPHRNLP